MITRLLLLIAAPAILLNTTTPAYAEVWDVFTWDYVRVYSDRTQFSDIHTGGGGDFLRKSAQDDFADSTKTSLLEITQYDYNRDLYKIRFDFDGSLLSLNRDGLSSVGGSSELRYALRLAGSWAAVGGVSGDILTADPFASFISTGYGNGYINWSAETPAGYTTQLLLGFDFEGNEAATYTEANWPNYSVVSTMALDRYLPKMSNQSHSYRQVNPHTFTLTYSPVVPEPSAASLLVTGLGWIMVSVKRRK